jgi:hypothetical protein
LSQAASRPLEIVLPCESNSARHAGNAHQEDTMKASTNALRIKTSLKAGGLSYQHNRGLTVRSAVKAGGMSPQHNRGLKVRSAVKAGGMSPQHNRGLKVRLP